MRSFTYYKEWLRGTWRDPAQHFQKRKARTCPCCGYRGLFVSAKRRSVREFRCPNCASRPRDRQIALMLDVLDLDLGALRIMHFAPEWWLFKRLRSNPRYVGGDILKRPNANAIVDITDIRFPDKSFDLIVCNHVLEHVPDDMRALKECARVLDANGLAIFTIPVPDNRLESWDPPEGMPKDQVEEICGWDHKRIYGLDVVNRFMAAGFEVGVAWFTAEQEESHRFFKEPVFLLAHDAKELDRWSNSAVFTLARKREDLLNTH
ncbi:MAG TPA: SAM-dependent methyltransferase [Rhodospirillaceae bacterium]|jgi:SAM-dependent methyltransferase|nr:methyltransferase domain-containing protein [Alphaproteobacteria bacterium]HBH26556.1 SAM-dependent methyltransferase [Rhodospirillaceae bacterium]